MPVFNWIQTDFADRPNFVSDAPDDVARAIAQAFSSQPASRARCEFGSLRVDTTAGSRACSYMRYAPPSPDSTVYIHAVVSSSEAVDPTLSSVEALFRTRYGNPPEARLQQLVERIAHLPVAEATLALTELFLSQQDLGGARKKESAPRKAPRRRLAASTALPWLFATAAAAVAGFLLGNSPTTSLAPVGAPPPGMDLTRRIERLEGDQGPAGISLRGQLEYERKEHRRILEEKQRELEEYAAKLASLRESPDTSVATDPVVPVASTPPESEEPAPVAASRPVEQAVVYADLLWVREGPGVKYLRISALDDGVTVDLAGPEKAGWVQISAPVEGWVASDFLDLPAVESEAAPAAAPTPSDSDELPGADPGVEESSETPPVR